MCIAIPYKVVEIKENFQAEIEVAGTRQEVSIRLFPEVGAGDWILVNLGSMVAKISEDEAREIIHLYQEIAEAETLYNGSLKLKNM